MTSNGVFSDRGGFIEVANGLVTGSGSNDLVVDKGSWISAYQCVTSSSTGTAPAVSDTNLTGGFNFSNNGGRGFIWA